MMRTNFLIHSLQVISLSLLLLVAPGCCWGGCFEKCKPCNPCKPCKPCDDSCVVIEPKKSNRSYQKNLILMDEEDDDVEIVELENEI